MELKSKGGAFKKFEAVGSSIEGTFVSFNPARETPWGPKPGVTLADDDGNQFLVDCPTTLANIIKDNLDNLVEMQPKLKLTWTGSQPSKKGSPMKLFKVETL